MFISVCLNVSSSLKCYVCTTDGSKPCNDTHLEECPKNQAFDRCITKTYRISMWSTIFRNNFKFYIKFLTFLDGKINGIVKECALAPCNMRDVSQKILLGDDCNKDNSLCTSCCKEDACNKSSNVHFDYLYLTLLAIIFWSISFNLYQT